MSKSIKCYQKVHRSSKALRVTRRKKWLFPQERLLITCQPGGIVYSDRGREEHGDYARLAFLSYKTLNLSVAHNCPLSLKKLILPNAAAVQCRKGEFFETSACGQGVILGAQQGE